MPDVASTAVEGVAEVAFAAVKAEVESMVVEGEAKFALKAG